MELVRLASLSPLRWHWPAVSVGNFDGVHRGHQVLAAAAVADARKKGGTSVVLTFDPHPSQVLSPDRAPRALMTTEQKAEMVATLGVDWLVVLPFTAELSERGAEEFIRLVLVEALGARLVVVGEGFRFGHRRTGDTVLLRALGRRLGFRVHAHAPVSHQGAPISSTRIREALARGDVEAAREMLGRRFFVDGAVVEGAKRGRTLGIPTANLAPINETLPGNGVYACFCHDLAVADRRWRAVVNIGRRPTFGGSEVGVEAHMIEFSGDLYGRRLRISFVERLREERHFSGPEALIEQVRHDIERTGTVLENA